MFVATRSQVIRSYEGYEIEDGMIEKLDEMLTAYGVQHFFTLPLNSTDGIANDDRDVMNVLYDGDNDRMTFNLVYMLWAKTVRNISDDRLIRAMSRISSQEN